MDALNVVVWAERNARLEHLKAENERLRIENERLQRMLDDGNESPDNDNEVPMDDCMVCGRWYPRDAHRVHLYEPFGTWQPEQVAFVAVCGRCHAHLYDDGMNLVRLF